MHFRVPGSTTNLAHGFDCLGIALGLANTVTVERTDEEAVRAPEAADPGLEPMAERVRAECARAWGVAIPGFAVRVAGEVPIARGMGSSATILCGVAAACRVLAVLPDDPAAILAVAAAIEGHPDNVAAAVLGGVTVVGTAADGLHAARIPVPPDLLAVVAIPPFEVKTSEAWHERYRAPLNTGFAEARAAAVAAGALGTIISGSGSTVLAFVRRGTGDQVRNALAASYHSLGIAAQVLVVPFDNQGLRRIG
jgi:homoserine kinase